MHLQQVVKHCCQNWSRISLAKQKKRLLAYLAADWREEKNVSEALQGDISMRMRSVVEPKLVFIVSGSQKCSDNIGSGFSLSNNFGSIRIWRLKNSRYSS